IGVDHTRSRNHSGCRCHCYKILYFHLSYWLVFSYFSIESMVEIEAASVFSQTLCHAFNHKTTNMTPIVRKGLSF
ncbi:MAG: hypothetical protein K2H71_11605, partial [Muribaculaceae bacterium]|nr:hypothetical protein [Muribaculaceae bacterium]